MVGISLIFSLFREALPALMLLRVKDILNSTVNGILDDMKKWWSFADGVNTYKCMSLP